MNGLVFVIVEHAPRSWADIHADELADAIRARHRIGRDETRIRSWMNRLQRPSRPARSRSAIAARPTGECDLSQACQSYDLPKGEK